MLLILFWFIVATAAAVAVVVVGVVDHYYYYTLSVLLFAPFSLHIVHRIFVWCIEKKRETECENQQE